MIGKIPFLKQLLWKISAKLELITHVIPKSNNAQGACSLEEPHPKFFPAIKIFDLLNGVLFKTKSLISLPLSSYLISKNKFLPNPVLLIVLRNCLGIIISVSILTIGKYAGILFSVLNFCI